MKIQNLLDLMNSLAPLKLAESWDNTGLLLGDPEANVQNVMTCLNLSTEVVKEAIDQKTDLIVAHHPILFRGVKSITTQDVNSQMVWNLARAGISLLSHHTAWDSAQNGANHFIAQKLGLSGIKPLRPAPPSEFVKIAVFVPVDQAEVIRDAAFKAGAGHIGQYSQCSFTSGGTGTFLGHKGANPTIGQVGIREMVQENRIEFVCPKSISSSVLQAIRQAHSYEEPAIDVYPLSQVAVDTKEGVGRFGALPAPVELNELARLAAQTFTSNAVQITTCPSGNLKKPISTVAVACGAGDDLVDLAIAKKVDVIVTGELRFHTIMKLREAGLSAILLGHYASERVSMEYLAELLKAKCPDLAIWASRTESEPLINI